MYDLNDYVVIISPALEEDVWRGDVEVKIAWSADNDLEARRSHDAPACNTHGGSCTGASRTKRQLRPYSDKHR